MRIRWKEQERGGKWVICQSLATAYLDTRICVGTEEDGVVQILEEKVGRVQKGMLIE